MTRIEIVGTVDEQYRLSLPVPTHIKSGSVRVILEMADDNGDDWRKGVTEIWARDWSDSREDIYTLEDGEPIVDAR